jgi:hypothetical protein
MGVSLGRIESIVGERPFAVIALGRTYPVREDLKRLGFHWSQGHGRWQAGPGTFSRHEIAWLESEARRLGIEFDYVRIR